MNPSITVQGNLATVTSSPSAILGRTTIYVGDCRETLRRLPAQSVHCVVTSPPYYGLRAYGTEPQVWGGDAACQHEWGDRVRGAWANEVAGPSVNVGKNGAVRSRPKEAGQFCAKCGAWRGDLGLEPDVDLFLANMVEVFREVGRVLRDDGTLWLNIGDSYSGSGKGPQGQGGVGAGRGVIEAGGMPYGNRRASNGIPPKNLMLIPWRLVLALQADGWNVRSVISWQKAAPMPESVADRPTNAWEPIFLLAKRGRYFYDAEAVREPGNPAGWNGSTFTGDYDQATEPGLGTAERVERAGRAGRNLWSYWRDLDDAWLLGPEPFGEAHFATFPTEIPRRAILAGTSARGCCPRCGAPWRRVTDKRLVIQSGLRDEGRTKGLDDSNGWDGYPRGKNEVETTGWQPACHCNAGEPVPATVLDPFGGAGTTALAANRNGRHAILCELNPVYADMARRRLVNDLGMLAHVEVSTL